MKSLAVLALADALHACSVCLLAAVALLGPLACSMDVGPDFKDCHDTGCPAGWECTSGYIFASCEKLCDRHKDCPEGLYCSGCHEKEPCHGHCYPGCRDASECGENLICFYGQCRTGPVPKR